MTQTGIQITCTGCGCTTFMKDRPILMPLNPYTEEIHTYMYNENQSDSWSRVCQTIDLCPRCHKIYETMMCKFYEDCGEARDNECYVIPNGGKNDQT